MNPGTHKTEVSAFLPPTSDYLGADPVGTRYAAMKRAAWTPAALAHHLGKSLADILPVLRNESQDPRITREVDAALGILPDQVPGLDDTPEEKPVSEMTTDEIVEELRQGAADLDAGSPLAAPRFANHPERTPHMNTLADYSPGEIFAAYTVAIIIASAAGAVAGVIADRIRVARAIRRANPLMRIPLPAAATRLSRHRSEAAITRDADGRVTGVKYPATGTEARA